MTRTHNSLSGLYQVEDDIQRKVPAPHFELDPDYEQSTAHDRWVKMSIEAMRQLVTELKHEIPT